MICFRVRKFRYLQLYKNIKFDVVFRPKGCIFIRFRFYRNASCIFINLNLDDPSNNKFKLYKKIHIYKHF